MRRIRLTHYCIGGSANTKSTEEIIAARESKREAEGGGAWIINKQFVVRTYTTFCGCISSDLAIRVTTARCGLFKSMRTLISPPSPPPLSVSLSLALSLCRDKAIVPFRLQFLNNSQFEIPAKSQIQFSLSCTWIRCDEFALRTIHCHRRIHGREWMFWAIHTFTVSCATLPFRSAYHIFSVGHLVSTTKQLAYLHKGARTHRRHVRLVHH